MSVSKHPVALQLEQRVGGATKLLATVMALPLVDGIFAALVVAGVLASPVGVIETGILIFGGSATIAVILAEMDGVETISYDEQADKFSAWADLDAAESDDSTLPRPYHEDALHNGAISGDVPEPDSGRTLDAVLSELDARIEDGEIELEALLSRIEDRVERTTFEADTVLDS